MLNTSISTNKLTALQIELLRVVVQGLRHENECVAHTADKGLQMVADEINIAIEDIGVEWKH